MCGYVVLSTRPASVVEGDSTGFAPFAESSVLQTWSCAATTCGEARSVPQARVRWHILAAPLTRDHDPDTSDPPLTRRSSSVIWAPLVWQARTARPKGASSAGAGRFTPGCARAANRAAGPPRSLHWPSPGPPPGPRGRRFDPPGSKRAVLTPPSGAFVDPTSSRSSAQKYLFTRSLPQVMSMKESAHASAHTTISISPSPTPRQLPKPPTPSRSRV